MSIQIRALKPEDYECWHALWQDYLKFNDEELSDQVTQQTWRWLINPEDGEPQGLVALDDGGRLIGFAHILFHRSTWTDGFYCYLEDLFIDAGSRGRGAGRALLRAAEKAAVEKDCAQLYLITGKRNKVARGLYDKEFGGRSGFVHYAKSYE